MAITAHPKSSYQFCFRRTAKFLGIASPNSPEGDLLIATSPYTADMLKKQLCQADTEICALIASVTDHPFRGEYFTEQPDPIADGARIPGYIGVHGGVFVESSPNQFTSGRLAQSLDHLNRVKFQSYVYGNSPDLYFIDNGVIHLAAAARAKIFVPTIPIADEGLPSPEFFSPKVYQMGLVAHAIANLRVVGADAQHRNDWTGIWSAYMQMILSGTGSLPEPERLQRISS